VSQHSFYLIQPYYFTESWWQDSSCRYEPPSQLRRQLVY